MGKGTGAGGKLANASEDTKAQALGNRNVSVLKKPANLQKLQYRGKIPMDEVKKHRTPQDAWMVIKGKVYDVSSWSDHPGGNVIFTTVGEDATDVFAAFHAGTSYSFLPEFEIGVLDVENTSKELVVSEKQLAFEAGYRKLRVDLIREGLFTSSHAWYYMKMFELLCVLGLGFFVASIANGSWLRVWLSSCIVALFLQQSGWMAHDVLHHQVFKNRNLGHYMGLFWGNLAQGFSIAWWTNKHNSHHAVPNLVESTADAADGDPDIDTMPFLAWSKQMFCQREEEMKKSAFGRFMIRNQALMYFPLLGFARLSWNFQGLQYAFPSLVPSFGWDTKASELAGRKIKLPWLESIFMSGHYLWFLGCVGTIASQAYASEGGGPISAVAQGVTWVLLVNVQCGLFLALVFGLGHNGMSVYHAEDRPDFWKLQVTTTRNIVGGRGIPQAFVDWFCGGLQYQVEHHLFPQVPRHNLPKVHEHVVRFCKEEGVTYCEQDMIEGTAAVLSHLRHVSQEFIEHFPAL